MLKNLNINIKPTDEYLPNSFVDAVALLERPYIYISKALFNKILYETKGRGDIFIYKNRKCTIGNVDNNKYAIMPIKD